MSDERLDAAAVALVKANGGRASYRPHYSTRNKAEAVLAAADAYDRDHGIVRVDCGSDDTAERVAAALAAVDGSAFVSDYYMYARAVLSELRKEEK